MPAGRTLPDTLTLGPVHITVTNLERSIPFYERSIGLELQGREGGSAAMGAGDEDLLVLTERRSANPAGRHAGLYHFALLHPSRAELARAAQRLLATKTPITGASDHAVSEAIYLSDPDGNGIELAADRPRESWGDLSDPTVSRPEPLDMPGLMALVEGDEPPAHADPELRVGHLHLHVGDVEEALRFYRDVIGFDVITGFPSAAFISAAGYHHHLGLNTWRGEGVPPAPPPDDAVGLRHWTVRLGDAAGFAELRGRVADAGLDAEQRDGALLLADPWANRILISAA
jgi:catechol 2,3-dioxygenase